MATYSKETEQYHISRIRSLLVRKPDITIREVQQALKESENSLELSFNYIARLMKKIRGEQAYRLNQYTINSYLAKFEDKLEELSKRLWLILQDKMTSEKIKIAAIRELRENSKVLFDKMFDAGVFERNLGRMKITETKLTPEEEEVLRKAIDYATDTAEQSEQERINAESSTQKESGDK